MIGMAIRGPLARALIACLNISDTFCLRQRHSSLRRGKFDAGASPVVAVVVVKTYRCDG